MDAQTLEPPNAAESTPNAADRQRSELDELTRNVIGAAYRVRRVLGAGFLEKVYENSMVVGLRRRGIQVRQQQPVEVRYETEIVGTYVADLLVEGRVAVELKAAAAIDPTHRAQCINYLRATGLPVCLLINFGPRSLEVRRIVWRF